MNGMVKGMCGLTVVGWTACAYGLSFLPTNLEEISYGYVQEAQAVDVEDESIQGLLASGTPVESAKPWTGVWNFVLRSEADEDTWKGHVSGTGLNVFSFTVGSKASVKVSGTMTNGAKVSVKTKLYADGEGVACIPVTAKSKTAGRFSFLVRIKNDGELEVGNVSDWDGSSFKKPFVATFLSAEGGLNTAQSEDGDEERTFSFSADIDELTDGYEWLSDISPDGESITCTAKKWKAAKSGKVKFNKKEGDYEVSDTNPSALKISYSKKKGTFSGSFSLYGLKETGKGTYKLKKYKASFKGVTYGGIGVGTATIKKVGTFPVMVE